MRAKLLREPLDADVAPARAAPILRGDERPFALLGAWAGGGAILGSKPVRAAAPEEDLFALLDDVPEVAPGSAAAVGGGWFGFLGFEARHRVERGHPPPPRPVPLGADGALAYYDHVLRMDADGRWWFEALMTPGREAAIERRRDELAARLDDPPLARGFSTRDWRWIPSPAGHAEAVEACRTRIAAGDLFQANLCMRLEGRLEGDAFDLFAAAAEALPTDRAAFVAGPWGTVASLSPEIFLTRTGRVVRSAPIKGTRPADRRDELAARLADPRPPRPFSTHGWRWTPSPRGHAEAVEACRIRIRAGDLFQANLCMRLEGRIDGVAVDLFAAAAAALPTDRAASGSSASRR